MVKTDRSETYAGEHYAILQLGVSIWNQWRASEPFTIPNLQNADLTGLHLENINLCRADLRNAKLCNAYLYEADFQAANLRGADLTRAGLIGANLHKANLAGAMVQQAYLAQSDLSNANLTGAYLQKTDLQAALLAHTNFLNTHIAEAEFTGCFDLTQPQIARAKGTHLACFDPQLSTALRVEKSLEEGIEISIQEHAVDPRPQPQKEVAVAKRMSFQNLSEQTTPKRKIFAASIIKNAYAINTFEKSPTESERSSLGKALPSPPSQSRILQRLAGLDARRNAAVTNVSLP